MHIALDIRAIGRQRTGDESVFFHLTRSLIAIDTVNRYSLLIDSRSQREMDHIAHELGVTNAPNAHIVPIGSGNKFLWNAIVVPRFLRTHTIDVYHTQYIVPFFVPRRTKIVTHIHDVSFKVFPTMISPKDLFFLSLLIGKSIRKASAVVAVSTFTQTEVVRMYQVDKKKVHVVPNAVSDRYFEKTRESDKNRVRETYGLPKRYILYVGTLQPRKNIPYLLEAFSRIVSRDPELFLVLVGNRNGYHFDTAIDSTLSRLNLQSKVIFPGFVATPDLPHVFSMARCFVFPSLYEGFGIPLLEAMARSIPVVASDIPVHREIAGSAAHFAPLDNIDAFAEIVYNASVLSSRTKAMREAGIQQAHSFSWDFSARRLLEVYKSIR